MTPDVRVQEKLLTSPVGCDQGRWDTAYFVDILILNIIVAAVD